MTVQCFINTVTTFDRGCSINCMIDEDMVLENGVLTAHGKAHLETTATADEVAFDFYKALTVRIAHDGKHWKAQVEWSKDWLESTGEKPEQDMMDHVEARGLWKAEDEAGKELDYEAQDFAEDMTFDLDVSNLSQEDQDAFVEGWKDAGGYTGDIDPGVYIDTPWCMPWLWRDPVKVDAYELTAVPTTMQAWGAAWWAQNRVEIEKTLAEEAAQAKEAE